MDSADKAQTWFKTSYMVTDNEYLQFVLENEETHQNRFHGKRERVLTANFSITDNKQVIKMIDIKKQQILNYEFLQKNFAYALLHVFVEAIDLYNISLFYY